MLDVESQPVALLVPAFVESYAPEGEQAQEYKQHGLGAQYQIGECRRLCLPQAVYAQCEYYGPLPGADAAVRRHSHGYARQHKGYQRGQDAVLCQHFAGEREGIERHIEL